MAHKEKRRASQKYGQVEGERHEPKAHRYQPIEPGSTPQQRTGQEADFERPRKGPFSELGYAPPSRTDVEEDEEIRKRQERFKSTETKEQGPRQGTFINIRTGEVRTYFAIPPRGDWQMLSPRLDITLEEARELVRRGGYGSLKPEQVHF